MKMLATSGHIGCLVLFTALGKSAALPIQREVTDWLDNSGPEWTANRTKSIWNATLCLKNGEREKARSIYQANSISYHKDTLIPKGHYGHLVQAFLDARKPQRIRKIAACLRFYTSLQLERHCPPTEKQYQKAKKSISTIYQGTYDLSSTDRLLRAIEHRWNRVENWRKEKLKATSAPDLHSTSWYYHPKGIISLEDEARLLKLPYGSMVLSLLTSTNCTEHVDKVRNSPFRHYACDEYGVQDDHYGRVTCFQEQGIKSRVVFQPSATVQLQFAPLHGKLQAITDHLYPLESCYKDQREGAIAMTEHLRRGETITSVDLSSATDRFPRKVSEDLLVKLGLGEWVQPLEQVCNQPCVNAMRDNALDIYYEVGQPMGLYGSFPLFHLTNLAVADYATQFWKDAPRFLLIDENLQGRKELSPFADGSFFKVCGDDIIFSDPRVAGKYVETMQSLGCEISESKTFSGKVAEFAGFLSCESSGGFTTFRPYKVPSEGSITNPLEFVHSMGSSVRQLGPRWDSIFESYRATISYRTIDLEPFSWLTTDDSQRYGRLHNMQPWVSSLSEYIQHSIEMKYNSDKGSNSLSKAQRCAMDWLREKSGYNFLNQDSTSYLSSVIFSEGNRDSRLNDRDLVIRDEIKHDKENKRKNIPHVTSHIDRFWNDPLNRKFKDYIDNKGDLKVSIFSELSGGDVLSAATVAANFTRLLKSSEQEGTLVPSRDADKSDDLTL